MTDATNPAPPVTPPAATAPPPPATHPASPQQKALPPAPVRTGPPVFTARPAGVNEFRIYENDKPVGKTLSPQESATVLAWVQSVASDI